MRAERAEVPLRHAPMIFEAEINHGPRGRGTAEHRLTATHAERDRPRRRALARLRFRDKHGEAARGQDAVHDPAHRVVGLGEQVANVRQSGYWPGIRNDGITFRW